MTTDRDIAPLIRSWLREDPDESAEHVLDAALAIVDTTPQRPAARWPARRFDMNLIVRLGVAAAVLAMAVALGYSIFQNVGTTDPGPDASPRPSATSDAPAAASLPDELAHLWIAEPTEVEGLDVGDRLLMDLRNQVFSVTPDMNVVQLVSAPSIGDGGILHLETIVDGTGCDVGAAGSFGYSLSPGGGTLSVQSGDDDCAPRAAAVARQWRRSACRAEVPCLGVMEAGRQSTLLFDPFRENYNPATARYGAMTYQVPDGWANADDRTHIYTVMRADSYAEQDPTNCLDCPDGVWIGASPRANVIDCTNSPDESVGTSAEALADWIRAHPHLEVSDGPALQVDGRPTFVLDIVAPEREDACVDPIDNIGHVPLFSHSGYSYGIRTGDRHRLLLVEIDTDRAMLIGVDSFDPDDVEAVIAETQPIIESIRLTAP